MTTTTRPHGTYARYSRGCRCDECREYQGARVARNRADRLASGRLSHGTRSAWDAGCRCTECGTAHRTAARDYYKRKKAAV